jgi:predicted transposase/invertase (TIGR01784 family)
VSPQLGVRLENSSGDLELYRPDGKRFESFVEIAQRAEQEAQRAEQEAQARYSAIDRLFKLGLSLEQVAEALGFSIEQVNTYRENHPG